MTDKELQQVKDWFENLEENEKINLWNEFCDDNKYYDNRIYSLDGYMLESFFGSIEEFAKSVSNSDHFNYNDSYFKVGDVYNDILTGDYLDDLADVDNDFYNWLLENKPDILDEEDD